ncbi:phosphopantetheine-binding protein [Lentzea sp. BCCO 10_0856]|uniref:Phosphopantetheine-binding protein n=1 Tax=Lentzea miocenica TaxID=3095431 RepID=A0ABU4TFC7_9PSEU|nr:phosphopantetheine-binding protein [Lentzea sp. BCCO 10_0856]MDX8036729.1 phosphopantetheine-binding protein [Lentzea sp. BCCO 10_0856]
MSTTIDRLSAVLVSRFGITEGEVSSDSKLTDLDLDSLALIELGMVAEKEFGIKISEEDVSPSDTIAKVASLIDGKVGVAG